MFIIIPLGMKYTARAWGSTIKHVTCAHCQTEFVYEMRRAVAHQTSAPAFIGRGNAQDRAAMGAQKVLQRTLDRDHDLIPCPKCLRLQPAMNRIARKFYLAWIFGLWVVTLFVWFFAYMSVQAQHRDAPAWANFLVAVSTVVAVALAVWVCLKEFRAAATDRAQLRAEAESQNFARLYLPRILSGGWLWTRATLFESPNICAACGAPSADRTLHRFIGQLTMRIETRICAACHRRARRKRFLYATLTALAGVPAAFALFYAGTNWELSEIVGWALCIGLPAGLLLMAIVNNWFLERVGFPIQFRKFSASHDSVELRFQSPAATEVFLASAITRMNATLAQATRTPDASS